MIPFDVDYSIKRYPLGVAIFAGGIPISDFESITKMVSKGMKEPQFCPGIAAALGAWGVISTKENAKKWMDELAKDPDWLKSGDTGISSKTIYAVMTGKWHILHGGMDGADAPGDPDDFGRCYRLLKRFPEYRVRLPEVAAKFPAWAPLVREWDRMTEIYERDFPTGESKELMELMRQLGKEVAK